MSPRVILDNIDLYHNVLNQQCFHVDWSIENFVGIYICINFDEFRNKLKYKERQRKIKVFKIILFLF